jgi:hypothetical protein
MTGRSGKSAAHIRWIAHSARKAFGIGLGEVGSGTMNFAGAIETCS